MAVVESIGRNRVEYRPLISPKRSSDAYASSFYAKYLDYKSRAGFTSAEDLQYIPSFVFLNDIQGVARASQTLMNRWPIVLDGGAMFGVAFLPEIRTEVGKARKEKEPLATVSVVTTHQQMLQWLDKSRLDPRIRSAVENGALDILSDISFLRIPANDYVDQNLRQSAVNDLNEIQIYCVAKDNPLLYGLMNEHNQNYFLVRSTNMSGSVEETSVAGAYNFAQQIGAPIFAVRHKNFLFNERNRKRVGSSNIIRITRPDSKYSFITLVREGNMSADTTERLLKNLLVKGIDFVHWEEKKGPRRKTYNSPWYLSNPQQIRQDLLNAVTA